MPKYAVLTPVEHDLKLYVPKGTVAAHHTPVLDAEGKVTGYTAPSGGNGQAIPVDTSGFIELANAAAILGPLRAAGSLGEAVEEPTTTPKKK